jgi:hypothetical protein
MIVISVLSLYNLSSQNSNPNDPSTCWLFNLYKYIFS